MTVTTALMITLTLILAFVMVPKIYSTWLISAELYLEGEARSLRLLLAEQKRWVLRHFGIGTLVTFLVWMTKHSKVEVPDGTAAVMASYAVISLILAVAESLLAQHIDVLATSIPASALVQDDEE